MLFFIISRAGNRNPGWKEIDTRRTPVGHPSPLGGPDLGKPDSTLINRHIFVLLIILVI